MFCTHCGSQVKIAEVNLEEAISERIKSEESQLTKPLSSSDRKLLTKKIKDSLDAYLGSDEIADIIFEFIKI